MPRKSSMTVLKCRRRRPQNLRLIHFRIVLSSKLQDPNHVGDQGAHVMIDVAHILTLCMMSALADQTESSKSAGSLTRLVLPLRTTLASSTTMKNVAPPTNWCSDARTFLGLMSLVLTAPLNVGRSLFGVNRVSSSALGAWAHKRLDV